MPDKENQLLDPYVSIVNDLETKQDDALYLASFVDSEQIVKALKAANYTVERKIEILTGVLNDVSSSSAEQIRAMKLIDEMLANSLSARGIQVRPSGVSGITNPIGQPQALHSVEMVEKSVKMTMANTKTMEETKEDPQPLKENTDGKTEENEDDSFYTDHRGEQANVFRPARGELKTI
jgi:hypothetical protein